jgi:trk system potassium uptake protein TrkH
MTSPLAVLALVGRMVVLFALMMAVPLAFAWFGGDAALPAFVQGLLVAVAAGAVLSAATLRFRRELQPRDGFVLVGIRPGCRCRQGQGPARPGDRRIQGP